MRISDWSSDVCSSDLAVVDRPAARGSRARYRVGVGTVAAARKAGENDPGRVQRPPCRPRHRVDQQVGMGALFGSQGHPVSQAGSGASYLGRSEEHTSELQSLMRISYAVFCLKKKKTTTN